MRVAAVIVAAGSSQRFGTDKLNLLIEGEPVWFRSFRMFRDHPLIDEVVVVTAKDKLPEIQSLATGAVVVTGGATRAQSARNGVAATSESCQIVLIHDAARPHVEPDLIKAVVSAAHTSPAVVPVLAVTDTIKQRSPDGLVTLDRSQLVAVQTPQAVWRAEYLAAEFRDETDDVQVMERAGHATTTVPGNPRNIKITVPDDIPREALTMNYRTGLGYDIHSFSTDPNRPMWLCGVEFDDRPGLDGHSDADAALHALVDALLGAAGLGDIGQIYANTDPQWKNAPSGRFVSDTAALLTEKGWHIMNVDISVVAERPKIMVRHEEIRQTIAGLLAIDVEKVSVKATTNERLGAIGRGEGVAAFAVATIARPT